MTGLDLIRLARGSIESANNEAKRPSPCLVLHPNPNQERWPPTFTHDPFSNGVIEESVVERLHPRGLILPQRTNLEALIGCSPFLKLRF